MPWDQNIYLEWVDPAFANVGRGPMLLKIEAAAYKDKEVFDPGFHSVQKRVHTEMLLWGLRSVS